MPRNYKTTVAAISGLAIGVATVQTLHAQMKPPAYVVTSFQSITDPNGMKTVMERSTPAILAAAGGHYIIRSNDLTGLQGTPPKRFVVIGFDNLEKAQAWANSEGHKETIAIRAKSSDSLCFMVEGVTE